MIGQSMENDEDYRYWLEMSDDELAQQLQDESRVSQLARESDHWTLLHHAAFDGNVERCRLLLDVGAHSNVRNNDICCSPLHYAARKSAGCVKLLLAAGSNVNATDAHHRTALHWAAVSEEPDVRAIIDSLVAAGSQLDAADEQQQTPLLTAASFGNIPAIEILLDLGANIEARDINGDRLIDYLQKGGHFEREPILPRQQWEVGKEEREKARLRLIGRIS